MNPIATLFPHLSLPPSLPLLCLSLLGAAGRPFPTSRLCPPGALPVGLRGAQRGCWNRPCPTRGNPDFSSQRLLSPAAPPVLPQLSPWPTQAPSPQGGFGSSRGPLWHRRWRCWSWCHLQPKRERACGHLSPPPHLSTCRPGILGRLCWFNTQGEVCPSCGEPFGSDRGFFWCTMRYTWRGYWWATPGSGGGRCWWRAAPRALPSLGAGQIGVRWGSSALWFGAAGSVREADAFIATSSCLSYPEMRNTSPGEQRGQARREERRTGSTCNGPFLKSYKRKKCLQICLRCSCDQDSELPLFAVLLYVWWGAS